MRALILVTGAALSLAACGSNETAEEGNNLEVNTLIVDNAASIPDGTTMDANAMGDMNMVDANTAAAMQQDMNTNAPDANLANGM
ncbi:MAG: hypothetical protein ACJ8EY_02860 [Sphingomicrobium sp.]